MSELWIASLLLDCEYQRLGIGSKVVSLIENYFKEKHKTMNVYLSVVENNKTGINFWHKNNYKNMRTIQKKIFNNEIKHNVIIMKKVL